MVAVTLLPRLDSEEEALGLLYLRVLEAGGTWSREVPLRFVDSGEELKILASREELPRWAGALSGGSATWRIGDRTAQGFAEVIEEPGELAILVDEVGSKYGPRELRRWFPGGVHAFRLRERAPDPMEYAQEVQAYFDHLAPQYDSAVDGNPLDRMLRSVSNGVLERVFHPGQRVLEIGCGTGLETLPLARRGVRVLATDVSSEMLNRLALKAGSERLDSVIEIRQVGARAIASLLADCRPGSFDGAFSDFGALNCEPDLADLPAALHRLVRPGGTLVLGIWNRFCASEAVLSLVSRQPHRAVARLETPVPVGHSRYGVPVYARGTGEFLEGFLPFFAVERVTGLPVFVPPYDFVQGFSSRSSLLAILQRLDTIFAARFPFNRFGDHFLLELRRRP